MKITAESLERWRSVIGDDLAEKLAARLQKSPVLVFSPEEWAALRREPRGFELAQNFAGAMARFVAAGVPVLTAEEYAAREAACRACIHPRDGQPTWEESAYFGLGKCRACGCSRLKRWMRTERCRLDRWPELP